MVNKKQVNKQILFLICMIFLVSPILAWDSNLNNGLMAYFNFNDSTEIMGTGYNLQTNEGSGGSFQTSNCLINDCANITANNNFKIQYNQYMGMVRTIYGGGAISVWVYPTENGTNARAIIDTFDGGSGYQIDTQINGFNYQPFIQGELGDLYNASGIPLSLNIWHNIVLIMNDSDYYQLYIDGNLQKASTLSQITNTTSLHISIGTSSYDGSRDYIGLIDELGFWNRSLNDSEVLALWNNGNGTSYSPEIPIIPISIITNITNCTELQNMNNNLTENYILSNNIDCSDTINWNGGLGFLPIGNDTASYTGNFDGNGYNITNLFINNSVIPYQLGLFGWITGTIQNVKLISPTIINVQEDIGSLVGFMDSGSSIINCSAEDVYVSCGDSCGGLIGYFLEGTIINSFVTGIVYGSQSAGGLIGVSSAGAIQNSYANVNVTGLDVVGGFIGTMQGGLINSSYSVGKVIGESSIGGFAGRGVSDIIIENSFSSGIVIGNSNVGGFLGYIGSGFCNNSYWDTETSGQNSSACGEEKTTAEMKNQSTFVNWDFINIWNICSGIYEPSYPHLILENYQCSLNSDYPFVYLNSPVDYYNSTSSSIIFNCSAINEISVINLTLFINGIGNYTIYNSTEFENLSLQTTLSLPDGDYNWSCLAYDNINLGTQSDTRFFNVNTYVSPTPTPSYQDNILYQALQLFGVGIGRFLQVLAFPLAIFILIFSLIAGVILLIKTIFKIEIKDDI